jgi:hypothetical protein
MPNKMIGIDQAPLWPRGGLISALLRLNPWPYIVLAAAMEVSMQVQDDSELPIFIRDQGTGRLVFNPKAVMALGLSPDDMAQCGYAVHRQISSPSLTPDQPDYKTRK